MSSRGEENSDWKREMGDVGGRYIVKSKNDDWDIENLMQMDSNDLEVK